MCVCVIGKTDITHTYLDMFSVLSLGETACAMDGHRVSELQRVHHKE